MKQVILFYLCCILFSCKMRNEIQKQIFSQKNFIENLSFNGKIESVEYHEHYNFNKFQIIVDVKETNQTFIPIGNQSFQPYYSFLNFNKLKLSVTKQIFDSAQTGSIINKLPQSRYITIANKNYELLNKKKFIWIPD